jgi:hypothetical protein
MTSVTLQVDPNRGFHYWGLSQIWNGNPNGGLSVPNVGDLSYDPVAGEQQALAIDPVTLYTTWGPKTAPQGSSLSQADILLGAGPGTQSESFRAYLDQSVLPFSIAPDARLHWYNPNIVGYKIFLGSDVSAATGQVISQYYDQSGNFISETLPVVAVPNADNNGATAYAPAPGSTLQSIADGSVVTLVAYDASAGPVYTAELIIKNTSYIRQLSAAMKYITSIELVSPWLDETVTNLLKVPINMPASSISMMGQVNYSDGTSIQLPINQAPFQLAGLGLEGGGGFIASTVGQINPLVLMYTPSSGEASYGTTPAPNQNIVERYNIQTIDVQGAFSPKLYAFPRWVDAQTGYTMEYYLTDLDRQQYYYVTPFVNPAPNSAMFNGTLYGQLQNLTVTIDLGLVDNVHYTQFNFATTFGVSLLGPGTNTSIPLWTVQETAGQNPAYGQNLEAVFNYQSVNMWNLDITCGCTNQQQWLDQLYGQLVPLINTQTETEAPTPNVARLIFATGYIEIPVSQWNATIGPIGNALQQGQLLYIAWIFRDTTGDQILGVSGLPVQIVQPV